MDLFNTQSTKLPLNGADVEYHPTPFLGAHPDALFHTLLDETPWEQRSIRIHGRDIPQPRLVSWHGDIGYTYSGLNLSPQPMSPTLTLIKEHIESLTGAQFNTVLLNLYRSGRDSIGMHADNEPELGPNPTIASVSLGAERDFSFEHKTDKSQRHRITLGHGSVLVMAGATQRNWKHGIGKVPGASGRRINLTFRQTIPI